MASNLSGFLKELKRRKVYHVGAAYAAAALVIATASTELYPILQLPEWTPGLVVLLLVVGFPVALVLAWAYELKPEDGNRLADPPSDPPANDGGRKSIVVLPFDNMSPDPGDAYFCDGLTEEVITDLSCCGLLRVISRNSAMALKDTRKDTKSIAKDLNVQYVLEGSVRKSNEDLLVTAQLIDANLDEHIWAERFTGTLQDVFEIQGRLSKSIVDSLKLKLTDEEEDHLLQRPIDDPKAYDTYLLATHEMGKITEEGIDRAIVLTEKALGSIGENALLASVLSKCHYFAYDFGFRHQEETLSEAERWASKALDLDPGLGQAHHAMGLVQYKRGDLPGFIRWGRRAVELSRKSDPWPLLAFVLAEVGLMEEASEYADQIVADDPLSFFSHWAKGGIEIFSGFPDLALGRLDDAVERLSDEGPFSLWWAAQAAAYAGQEDRARRGFERVAGMKAGAFSDLGELFRRALLDDPDGTKEIAERPFIKKVCETDEYLSIYVANAASRVGLLEEAIDWVEKGVAWGFTNHEFLSSHNRFVEPLREIPRFQSAVELAQQKATTAGL